MSWQPSIAIALPWIGVLGKELLRHGPELVQSRLMYSEEVSEHTPVITLPRPLTPLTLQA